MSRQLALLLALPVAACAKSTESIAPAYVSPLQNQSLNYAQLGEEAQRIDSALAAASQQQRDARTNDTVGVILLGLPVSTLSGGNVADQVARLKGEQKTVRQTMTKKSCNLGAGAGSPSPMARPTTTASAEDYFPVGGQRPLEGASYEGFTREQIAAYCQQDWQIRTSADGKTEYNPCFRRKVFR